MNHPKLLVVQAAATTSNTALDWIGGLTLVNADRDSSGTGRTPSGRVRPPATAGHGKRQETEQKTETRQGRH